MRHLLRLILVLLPSTALAETWNVDPSKSKVGFSVTHMMVNTVTGSFGTFTGSLTTDAAGTPTAITGEVSIASVDTKKAKRDAHLLDDDFFSADKFPKATFQSTAIAADGDGYKATGTLTIRDISKEVVLNLSALTASADGTGTLSTVATTEINRQEFGVTWSKLMDNGGVAVSDEVKLTLRIELKKAK